MSEKYSALMADALKLPEDERAELADRLYASLDSGSDVDSMTDEEFARDLERRHEEFLRDPSVAIPMEEVKRLTRID